MEDLKRKYARFLIEGCLDLHKGDKLFVLASCLIADFVELLKEEAYSLGITDFEILISDPLKQREKYFTLSYEELLKDPLFDKTKYNQMAQEGYAFLRLISPIPGVFEGVDADLLSKVNTYQMESIALYKEYQLKGLIKWNIAAVPNKMWAKDILGEDDEEALWEYILDICLIKEADPALAWQEKLAKLAYQAKRLNELKIDKLIYHNSLGTNLEIGLPKNYLFCSADVSNSKNIVNMPTEEVFTSPDRLRVEGIVYASKPLLYNGNMIEGFWLKFKEGKIIDYGASKGKDILKGIIETDEGSRYLGEVALVNYDSSISRTKLLFKETLYDENASCHLAIGESFPECIKEGLSLSNDELKELGLNFSRIHVDFFIGTKDLEIKAILQNGEEVVIMEEGNLVEV